MWCVCLFRLPTHPMTFLKELISPKPTKSMKTESLELNPASLGLASVVDANETRLPLIQLKNILVPLDLSEMSLKSLKYAEPFAKLIGAKLTLLHVVQPIEAGAP